MEFLSNTLLTNYAKKTGFYYGSPLFELKEQLDAPDFRQLGELLLSAPDLPEHSTMRYFVQWGDRMSFC